MDAASALVAPEPDREIGRIGMWVFLATELLFFGGLLWAYAVVRGRWPHGVAVAGAQTHVALGTLNTGLLLTSSALVAAAVEAFRGGRRKSSGRAGVLLGGAAMLGLAFLAIKGVEYAMEVREGLLPGPGFALAAERGAELFFLLYWVMTALHALHLAIGVALLAAFSWGTRRLSRWATPDRVEVAGLYWHFVDLVWIVLYPLLYLAGRNA
jgi:cytochrome c oxidase subunit 3